ncbi:MAG: hypothetical protein JXR76_27130 [Deltaproteobacteria bacterium]|nr:hypothetical protein [Deltaproteobacteria bacterium]
MKPYKCGVSPHISQNTYLCVVLFWSIVIGGSNIARADDKNSHSSASGESTQREECSSTDCTNRSEQLDIGNCKNDDMVQKTCKAQTIIVYLLEAPPTRTYCTFIPENISSLSLETVTLEWDPLFPKQLIRHVTLPGGKYDVRCYSEPARHAIDADVDYSWKFDKYSSSSPNLIKNCNGSLFFTSRNSGSTDPKEKSEGKDKEESEGKGCIRFYTETEEATSLADLPRRKPTTTLGDRHRSLAASSMGTEAIQAVAEVVKEELSARALRIARKYLQRELKNIHFDETSRLLEFMPLDVLLEKSDILKRAIVSDLINLSDGNDAERRALLALHENRLTDVMDGAYEILLSYGKDQLEDDTGKRIKAVIEECHLSGGCSVSRIRFLLESDNMGLDGNAITEHIGEISDVQSALRILSPGPTDTPQSILADALSLGTHAEVVPCDPSINKEIYTDILNGNISNALERYSTSYLGKAQMNTANSGEAIKLKILRQQNAIKLLASLVVLATSDNETATKNTSKSAILLKAVINNQKKRSVRYSQDDGHMVIISVGSSMFSSLGGGTDFWLEPLSLTIGLSADLHIKNSFGLHLELTPFDLGGYLMMNPKDGKESLDPSPYDFVKPAATLGFSHVFPESDLMVIWGITGGIGWENLGGSGSDSGDSADMKWYIGGVLGFYLPIWDFIELHPGRR